MQSALALCVCTLAAEAAVAAGWPSPQISQLIPDGGLMPPNAVFSARFDGGGPELSSDGIVVVVDGDVTIPTFSTPTCTVGTSHGSAGRYECVTTFAVALPPSGEVTLRLEQPSEELVYQYTVASEDDIVAPVVEGTVEARFDYYSAFSEGTSCSSTSPEHYAVTLTVPGASDDVRLGGYAVYVEGSVASQPLFVPVVDVDGPSAIVFDVLASSERRECYRVHAVDLAGNESEPLPTTCLDLTKNNPEAVTSDCPSGEFTCACTGSYPSRPGLAAAVVLVGLGVVVGGRRRRSR